MVLADVAAKISASVSKWRRKPQAMKRIYLEAEPLPSAKKGCAPSENQIFSETLGSQLAPQSVKSAAPQLFGTIARAEAAKLAEQLARIPKSKWSKAAIDLHLTPALDEKAVSQLEGFFAAHGHTASTILDALKDQATGDASKQYTRAQMQQLVN